MSVLPSCRNQSIDLLCKSVDLLLYVGNTGIQWVNKHPLLNDGLHEVIGSIGTIFKDFFPITWYRVG